jgi:hypothetical protein
MPKLPLSSFTIYTTLPTASSLLEAVSTQLPNQPLPMLRSTAAHFARFVGVTPAELEIAMIRANMPGFAAFLAQLRTRQGKKLARNSVASYVHHAHLLLRLAVGLGWRPTPSTAENAWDSLFAGIQLPAGCRALVRFAIARELPPAQFADKDIDAFIALKADAGRKPKYTRKLIRAFRRTIAAARLGAQLPHLSPPRTGYVFGISTALMPDPLQSELRGLLQFKTQGGHRLPRVARSEAGHKRSLRRDIRIRQVSAHAIEGTVSRLFGFAVQQLGMDANGTIGLLDLVTEPVIDAYIDWQLDVRLTSGSNFNGPRMLHAALHDAPQFKEVDFTWFSELLATIPEEDEDAVIDRKSAKYIPWATLCNIPGQIAEEKDRATPGTVEYAWLAHDQLFMLWLITFVHRQLNVRECRIGSASIRANLYKSALDAYRKGAVPEWAKDELRQNPGAAFWQLSFTKDEAKGKQAVRALVPSFLVPLLNDYLVHQRPLLVGADDRQTLFLNRDGNPLSAESLEDLFGRLTLRHAGRWSTPHLVRDAYAHAWLDDHPEDYLTVSGTLWHRSIRQTLERYGHGYDTARALGRSSAWLEQRIAR